MQSEVDKSVQTPDYALHYAAVNDLSDQTYALNAIHYQRLLGSILQGIDREAAIVDVGCGAGFLVHSLQLQGFKNVAGVDACASLVEIARQRGLPCTHVSEEYVESHSSEGRNRYAVVFLLDVLEHIPLNRQMAFLASLRHMLRPGGVLILSVPNASSMLAARWRYIDWTHTSAFTEHSLSFVLTAAGFDRVRYLPHEFMHRPRWPFLVRPSVLWWVLHRAFRGIRRLQVVAELGPQGWAVPLSLNLLAVATPATSAPPGGTQLPAA